MKDTNGKIITEEGLRHSNSGREMYELGKKEERDRSLQLIDIRIRILMMTEQGKEMSDEYIYSVSTLAMLADDIKNK